MHDTNDDRRLDGLEIMRALEHSLLEEMKGEMDGVLTDYEKKKLQHNLFSHLTSELPNVIVLTCGDGDAVDYDGDQRKQNTPCLLPQ